jgi:hypothetical protein
VFTALNDVFPAADDSFEERPSGSSAVLTFVVSGRGVMLERSAVLSACAWATARALDYMRSSVELDIGDRVDVAPGSKRGRSTRRRARRPTS